MTFGFDFGMQYNGPLNSGSAPAWTPASLFAASEVGAWYDAGDLSTMFEYNSASVSQIPVTSTGQPAHLWMDKSQGLVESETNVCVNGAFDADTDWTKGTGWSISGGVAVFSGSTLGALRQTGILEVGKLYRITGDCGSYSGGTGLQIYSGTSDTIPVMAFNVTSAGAFDGLLYAYTTDLYIRTGDGTTAATLDNIEIYEIAGNHAVANAATTAPILAQDGDGAYYLDFDGSNDLMFVRSMDLTATDQVMVAVSVNKLAESQGTIVAHASTTSSNGAFILWHSVGGATYYFRSRGTTAANLVTDTLYPLGTKEVVIAQSDISADFSEIEVGGEFAGIITSDQGSGNFGSHVTRIGGIDTYYANAAIYELIVRGENYADTRAVREYMEGNAGITASAPDAMPGIWTWFNDPRAIYANGSTYIGAIDKNGKIIVNELSEGASFLGTQFVDDHNNPALLYRADGKIQAFWTGHNVATYYTATSVSADDATEFGSPVELDASIGYSNYSYAHPFQLEGMASQPIYIFFRAQIDGAYTRGFSVSSDGGSTWAAGTRLLNWTDRPYLIAEKTSSTRIDFVVTDGHPSEVATNSIYHFYFDNGDWFDSSGTDIGDPPFDKVDLTLVYDGTTVNCWNWDIAADSTGAPCILYATFPTTTDHRYNFARWNGASWDTSEICSAGTYLYAAEAYYSGGVCMDHGDPFTVIASRESSGAWTLWKYTSSDSGETWSGSEIIDDGETYQIRPVFIRGKTSEPKIAYVSGDYTTYQSYNTNIRLASSA